MMRLTVDITGRNRDELRAMLRAIVDVDGMAVDDDGDFDDNDGISYNWRITESPAE
jgi:hypothetical protein